MLLQHCNIYGGIGSLGFGHKTSVRQQQLQLQPERYQQQQQEEQYQPLLGHIDSQNFSSVTSERQRHLHRQTVSS